MVSEEHHVDNWFSDMMNRENMRSYENMLSDEDMISDEEVSEEVYPRDNIRFETLEEERLGLIYEYRNHESNS